MTALDVVEQARAAWARGDEREAAAMLLAVQLASARVVRRTRRGR